MMALKEKHIFHMRLRYSLNNINYSIYQQLLILLTSQVRFKLFDCTIFRMCVFLRKNESSSLLVDHIGY